LRKGFLDAAGLATRRLVNQANDRFKELMRETLAGQRFVQPDNALAQLVLHQAPLHPHHVARGMKYGQAKRPNRDAEREGRLGRRPDSCIQPGSEVSL